MHIVHMFNSSTTFVSLTLQFLIPYGQPTQAYVGNCAWMNKKLESDVPKAFWNRTGNAKTVSKTDHHHHHRHQITESPIQVPIYVCNCMYINALAYVSDSLNKSCVALALALALALAAACWLWLWLWLWFWLAAGCGTECLWLLACQGLQESFHRRTHNSDPTKSIS